MPRLHAAVREHGWEIETIKLGEAPLRAAVGAMAVAEAAAAADWFVYRGQRTPPREPLDA